MLKTYLYTLSTLFLLVLAKAELAGQATNIHLTNTDAETILLGSFDPTDFPGGEVLDIPNQLAQRLIAELQPDSLKQLLLEMNAFGNRNTGSDTLSSNVGIGAARRWAKARMDDFAARSGGRMQVGYVQFDQEICTMNQHRNVLGVLPGVGQHANEVILLEGHIDSRCEDVCGLLCAADGMEDNASGTALVLELARVLSQYQFDRTIAFMLTIGEEQGLFGADAMALYCQENDVEIVAVLNNDVIGGVICGQTASPPGCIGFNSIDSINVRLFSAGAGKGLARYIKYQYEKRVAPLQAMPSIVNIMSAEDRTGRGGDHIPFRQRGFRSVRFTSANEHGNANVSDPAYSDRQHTSEDILGVDTDGDMEIDSFFVDVNYLYRNALINGATAGILAIAPEEPLGLTADAIDFRVALEVNDALGRDSFLLGIRNAALDNWDTLVHIAAVDTVALGLGRWYFSVAYIDDSGVESQWSPETTERVRVSSTGDEQLKEEAIELLPNVPNPFDEATMIRVMVNKDLRVRQGQIIVRDLNGRDLAALPILLNPGTNEVVYDFSHHAYVQGTYSYSLVVEGEVVATRWMVYAY